MIQSSTLFLFPSFIITKGIPYSILALHKENKHPQDISLSLSQPIFPIFIKMAKIVGPLICLLIIAMDIVAGILGIEAEIAQNKVKHLRVWIFECREPSHKAFQLGLAATILLALAHVIANLLGGFVCICSKDQLDKASANKQLAAACLILSWFILVVGFSMLIIGTMANSKSRRESCGFSHHKFLSIGGILCFVHGLFCISYYISAVAMKEEEAKSNQRGAAAGLPMGERGHHSTHS